MSGLLAGVTAILLCGGRGERLRPFTEEFPKALVPLDGTPLLLHLLRYLSGAGLSRFLVCVGHKADAIEAFLRQRADPAWDVACVDSGDASITDRLIDASTHVTGRSLICYGDTLANVELDELLRRHVDSGALATLTVYPLDSPFGVVEIDAGGRVRSFVEKPRLPHWINIGFLMCEPGALAYLRRGSDMPEFLSALVEAGVLGAYQHTGRHLTVNTEKERAAAETAVVEFYTYRDEMGGRRG